MNEYKEKWKDPRWQKKRLKIMERDSWRCQVCHFDSEQLAVHHIKYKWGKDPWDYDDDELITLCKTCHDWCHHLDGNEHIVMSNFHDLAIIFLRSINRRHHKYHVITHDEFKRLLSVFIEIICEIDNSGK
jgi:hypothetical protein